MVDHEPMQWVILTMGDRPDDVRRAIASVLDDDPMNEVILVENGGGGDAPVDPRVDVVALDENIGVPGGRNAGVDAARSEIVGFLDDDATLRPGATRRIRGEFARRPDCAVTALRVIDEQGDTLRRHVPRPGTSGADRSGSVAVFLGGACAVRRQPFLDVGGYFDEFFYAHEEVELAWRLVDRGHVIRYVADAEVVHPHTSIARHPDGWWRVGRNRVWVARRTLPWPIAIGHVLVWLVLGTLRAPGAAGRRAYVSGWRSGWRGDIQRSPISWGGVVRLTRCGRPPLI